jgi:hypothetical protein
MRLGTGLCISGLALSCACATAPTEAPPASANRPAFPRFSPGSPEPPTAGSYAGYLSRKGPCLGLTVGGRFATVIWPRTARLRFDARGLIVSDSSSGASLRLGDWLVGEGGPLPPGYRQPLGEPELSETMPIECARYPGYDGWIATLRPGFRKGTPPPS